MNFKLFFKCFSISFVIILLYRLVSLYSSNSYLCNQLIPDLNGDMVRSSAPICRGNWFINLLAPNFGSFLIWTLIIALIVGLFFYLISRRRQRLQIAPQRHVFVKSLKPSVIKVISTILLSIASYYGLLTIGFLGFGHVSPIVGIIAGIISLIFNLPGTILHSFGIRFNMFETSANPYAAMIVHVLWIYLLVCFVAYLIALRKSKNQGQMDITPPTSIQQG